MIKLIYSRAFSALGKKPVRLWAFSLIAPILAGIVSSLFALVPAVGICVSLLLNVSLTMIFLTAYKGEVFKDAQLFDAFKDWATAKRVLGGMLWMELWIVLWSLIPIVGPIFAVIRTYEYRLTPYILMTEPDVAATDAYKKSAEMTKGYKGKMFLADFLVGLVLGVLMIIPILNIIVAIAAIFVLPLFMGLVQAAFYEEIKNPTPAAPKYPQGGYPQYPQYQQAPQGYQQPQYPQYQQAPQGYQQAPQGYQQPQYPQYPQYQQAPQYQAPAAPQAPQAPDE